MSITTILAALVMAAQPTQGDPNPPPSRDKPNRAEIVVEAFKKNPPEAPLWSVDERMSQHAQYREYMDALEFVPADFAAMVEGRFRQADRNDDGKLSRAEMIANDRRRGQEPILIPYGNPEALRAVNGEANPYRALMINLDPRMIKNGDMDGDKQLNRFEALVAAIRQFKRMDVNGDMVVKGNELRFLHRRNAQAFVPAEFSE